MTTTTVPTTKLPDLFSVVARNCDDGEFVNRWSYLLKDDAEALAKTLETGSNQNYFYEVVPQERQTRWEALQILARTGLPVEAINFNDTFPDHLWITVDSLAAFDAWVERFEAKVYSRARPVGEVLASSAQVSTWNGWLLIIDLMETAPKKEPEKACEFCGRPWALLIAGQAQHDADCAAKADAAIEAEDGQAFTAKPVVEWRSFDEASGPDLPADIGPDTTAHADGLVDAGVEESLVDDFMSGGAA